MYANTSIAVISLCIIIVYIWGCIASYKLGKRGFISKFKEWTVGDRSAVIGISLLSWVGYIVVYTTVRGDRPAKW